GAKMSKSKGNVLDPLGLLDGITLEELAKQRTSGPMQPQNAKAIETLTRRAYPDGIAPYGTAAPRFTFAAPASPARDNRLDQRRLEGYRHICNKLLKAAPFVLMQTEDASLDGDAELSLADRWIISRLQRVEGRVMQYFDTYRFDLASQQIHDFVWHSFC